MVVTTYLVACLTHGQTHESTAFETLIRQVIVPQRRGLPRSRPRQLADDCGSDARRIRQWFQQHGTRSVIPPRHRRGVRKTVVRLAMTHRRIVPAMASNAPLGGSRMPFGGHEV
ncbi:hypothetical protein JOD20_000221 [Herpetosiphon giganteus]|nr:hypothetical protein [Herpetosiphon giganteus]